MGLTTIKMMHLADSALPVGGFAFSNGLEAASKCGMVTSVDGLERYLLGALQQWISFEAPFLRSFYDELTRESVGRYDRMMLSPSMRKASLAQGRGWLRVYKDLFPTADSDALRAPLIDWGIGPHYLPLMTASLKLEGATVDQVRELYLFTLLRDQTSAAVRLGLLGPSAAQSLQSRLEKTLIGALNVDVATPQRFTPLMDVAQMLQPSLYTKLFQN